jgi:hypothetical protein
MVEIIQSVVEIWKYRSGNLSEIFFEKSIKGEIEA